MEVLRKFKQKAFTEIYFISGEIVTIFDGGVWNYRDTRKSYLYCVGGFFGHNNTVTEITLPFPDVIKDALIEAGYTLELKT